MMLRRNKCFFNLRKIILPLIILLILAASGFSQSVQTQFHPEYYQKKSLFEILPDTPGEIIFLGDSITAGGNWTELFQDLRVKNRGISGDVTEGVLLRLEEIVRSSPAKIFLMIGINDLAYGKSVKQVADSIHTIIKKIKQKSPQTSIYLQSLLPVNSDIKIFPSHTDKSKEIIAVNNRLEKLAESTGSTYIDLYPAFVLEEGKLNPAYSNDGLHLTGAGYLLWKSLIQKYFKN